MLVLSIYVDILIYKKINFSYLTNNAGSLILHYPEKPEVIPSIRKLQFHGLCAVLFISLSPFSARAGQNLKLILWQERGIRQLTTVKLNEATWPVIRPLVSLVTRDDRAVAGFW